MRGLVDSRTSSFVFEDSEAHQRTLIMMLRAYSSSDQQTAISLFGINAQPRDCAQRFDRN
jgi:hypothetical protein